MQKGMTLEFKVTNQTITRLDNKQVVENSMGYLFAHFTFSEEWVGVTKTIKIKTVFEPNYVDVVLDANNECEIPTSLIKYPLFYFSVEGTSEGVLITTREIAVDVDMVSNTAHLPMHTDNT